MRIWRVAADCTWLVGPLFLTACLDGTGPRPRPGTSDTRPTPPQDGQLVWLEMQPRVITPGSADSIELRVAVSGHVDAVRVQTRTGSVISLLPINASLYSARLSPARLLTGYVLGDLHHRAGVLEVTGDGGTEEHILIVNVHDATVPNARVVTLAADVQAADHVVNIRSDVVSAGGEVPGAVLRKFYEHFDDDYTFVAVIESVSSPNKSFFVGVRNDITGLGIAPFNRGPTYGSAARLEGIVHYPNDSDFDLAETSDIHELAHRWMSFSTHPLLARGGPHWPLSSMAYGVMGWTDPATNDAAPFPFAITRQDDGTHVLQTTEAPRSFNDLELYFMGLLPGDSVRTHFVFADQNQRTEVRNNGILRGAVDSLRIADIVERDGARVPGAATAPREFSLATIVLSRNRLLSPEAMSFFDHMAARGARRSVLTSSDGFTRAPTLPFFLATGGRATLITRLRATAL